MGLSFQAGKLDSLLPLPKERGDCIFSRNQNKPECWVTKDASHPKTRRLERMHPSVQRLAVRYLTL